MEDSRDSIFGSKTRVKLLSLFLNSPDKSFYVREITRIIDEQVNSVRRELSNLENAGVVKSTTKDRRLYYSANQRFKYYIPLKAIFSGTKMAEFPVGENDQPNASKWLEKIRAIEELVSVFIVSGVLIDSPQSSVDMLLVGDNKTKKLSLWASEIEKEQGRDLNYTILDTAEFYYRYSARDRFITNLLNGPHEVVIDSNKILNN